MRREVITDGSFTSKIADKINKSSTFTCRLQESQVRGKQEKV